LPIKGEVLVAEGDRVEPNDVVARAMLPGLLQTVRVAERFGVDPKDLPAYLHVKEGDKVEKEQLIAETKGWFLGIGRQELHSDFEGEVETISEVTGHVLIREPSIPVDMPAYVKGRVSNIMEGEGAVVETQGAMVQGIFGVGRENNGPIRIAVSSPEESLTPDHIKPEDKGKILVGGKGINLDTLNAAVEHGVIGLVCGAVRDIDLTKFLGYDIGVAITGQENISLTLLCTEGFGVLQMAERTFELLKSLDGKHASINGATQIRAGVIRPEIIVPLEQDTSDAKVAQSGGTLDSGTAIRIIREPFFGRLGTVTGLPATLQKVDSGALVRVLTARLEDGTEVTVPRANVEIIATG
jgi:hypothetical protein